MESTGERLASVFASAFGTVHTHALAPMVSRKPALLLAVVLAFALAPACTVHEEPPSLLAPYATATLTAGVGLGDLKLNRTTLGTVVSRFGVEKVSVLASDQVGLELFYEQGQLSLLFLVEPRCMEKLKTGLRPATADLNAFLAQNPCVRETTLSSLSVRKGASVDASFFKGATEAGVRLWDPMQSATKHGQPAAAPKGAIAGLDLQNPEGELHFKPGIAFYYPTRAGASPAEMLIERITIYR